jgi:hypothetical protein
MYILALRKELSLMVHWIRYVIPVNALVMQQEYGITMYCIVFAMPV